MTKPLQLSETITQSLKCNTLQGHNENVLALAGTVDFTNATVTGLGGAWCMLCTCTRLGASGQCHEEGLEKVKEGSP